MYNYNRYIIFKILLQVSLNKGDYYTIFDKKYGFMTKTIIWSNLRPIYVNFFFGIREF